MALRQNLNTVINLLVQEFILMAPNSQMWPLNDQYARPLSKGRLCKRELEYGSEEKGSSLCRCSILLGFIMSKKQERLRSELLSEDKITNLLGFLT